MSDWRPTASLDALRERASLNHTIREFFAQRQVLEVETPALGRHAVTDVHIDCIAVPGYGFLQSSPEYHMKRLLAAGSGAIYQLSRVFRDGENGSRHNAEFSMLEWYRPGFTLQQLIDECCDLLQQLLPQRQVRQYRFRDVFIRHTGLDPLRAAPAQLQQLAASHGQLPELDRAALVDWLMACVVEPALEADAITVITDFPGWAAALAQTGTDADGEEIARRFEIYAGGIELANGYLELLDADEQARRFARDRAGRRQRQRPDRDEDERLLAALRAGLPACSGVAMGVDRILMVRRQASRISEVIAFPGEHA